MCIRDSCNTVPSLSLFVPNWQTVSEVILSPVSYTHLDVYKRQLQNYQTVFAVTAGIHLSQLPYVLVMDKFVQINGMDLDKVNTFRYLGGY